MNPNFREINAERQEHDENSVLNFYRKMTNLRHSSNALVYGSFSLAKKDWKEVLTYYRSGEDGIYFAEINLTSKPQKRPVCTAGFRLLASNTVGAGEALSPFEANVYKVN